MPDPDEEARAMPVSKWTAPGMRSLALEYRTTMDKDVVHAWAMDAADALKFASRTPAPGVEREDVALTGQALQALFGEEMPPCGMLGDRIRWDDFDASGQAVYDRVAARLLAMLPQKEGWRPTHRHVKRGTDYQFIDEADLQTDKPLADYAVVAVYRGSDGRLWVRPASEFNDGRFAPISPAHEGGEA